MADHPLISIDGLASRLAAVTGASPEYHARQARRQVREGALSREMRGGEGPTAPTLFNERGLCAALCLHTLSTMGLDSEVLLGARDAMKNIDGLSRTPGVIEPVDGLEFAIEKIREKRKAFLVLGLRARPFDEKFGCVGGYVTSPKKLEPVEPGEPEPAEMGPTIQDDDIVPKRGWIVLPLHRILKPLLITANTEG